MPYHSDPWYRNGSYRYLTVASATSLIRVAFCGLLISQSGSVSTYKHMVLTREITFVNVSRISDMTSPCPSVQAVPAWPRAPTHDNNQALYIFTVAILHPVCPDIALHPLLGPLSLDKQNTAQVHTLVAKITQLVVYSDLHRGEPAGEPPGCNQILEGVSRQSAHSKKPPVSPVAHSQRSFRTPATS